MVNLMHMHLLNEYDLLHSLGKWKIDRKDERAGEREEAVVFFPRSFFRFHYQCKRTFTLNRVFSSRM